MKTIPLLLIFLFALLLISCSPEDETTSSRKSAITFGLSHEASQAIPDGSSLLFSLQSPTGEIIFDQQIAELTRNRDMLVSEKISLPEGDYELTDFMIINEGEVIYAAPREASELSNQTATPVSHAIHVSNAKDGRILMDVMETAGRSCGKFGYDRFRKTHSTWRIAIYIEENGELILTDGQASLVHADGTSLDYNVNGITAIAYTGNPNAEWTLVAEKDGYQSKTTPFVFSEIPGHGNKIFKFVLEPATNEGVFTLMAVQGTEGDFDIELGFEGTGTIFVDWGDGDQDVIDFTATKMTISHYYATTNAPLAKITGDIDQITSVKTISVYMNYLNVTGLSGLVDLYLYGVGSDTLDLSQNTQLATLRLEGTYFNDIILGNSPDLKSVQVDNIGRGINDLVHEVFANAVTRNVWAGFFSYTDYGDFEQINSESLQYLNDLEEIHGWTVEFNDLF